MAVREKIIAVDTSGREPPHDEHAEAAVLSSVLSSPGALDETVDVLTTGDAFYVESHKRIYNAALQVRASGSPVDAATVARALQDADLLIPVGGFAAIARIVDASPNVANVAAHAKILLELYDRRRMIATCQNLAAEGFAWPGSARAYLERVRSTLDSALDQTGLSSDNTQSRSFAEVLDERSQELAAQWAGKREWTGASTGIEAWDQLIQGMKWGKRHVVAALTGGGKSTACMQAVIASAGKASNGEVIGWVVVNGEMDPKEIVDRSICAVAPVEQSKLQAGHPADPAAWAAHMDDVKRQLRGLPVEFVDGARTHQQIRAICRAVQRKWDRQRKPGQPRVRLRGLLVDYLQIMDLPKGDREDQAIGEFSRGIGKLTLELGLHTFLVSQFSREGSKSGMPRAQDLFGSSSLENDADIITYIHRPMTDGSVPELEDFCEFMLLKGRGLRRGERVKARFEGKFYRFMTADERDVERWVSAFKRVKGGDSWQQGKQRSSNAA